VERANREQDRDESVQDIYQISNNLTLQDLEKFFVIKS
jgi:hypothetical protein